VSGMTYWDTRIAVFDLETTGVDVDTARIVSACIAVLEPDGSLHAQFTWLADPEIEIPDAATAVHGITTERARADGRCANEVVTEVVDVLRALLDAGIPVVAYNAAFDFSLLKHEALRHGIRPIDNPCPVIDPLVVDKAYDRWRRGKRTLEQVAAHYAVRLDGAHDASADAVAAGRVAQALAGRFATRMPPTAQELHTRQIAWARAQAESLTEYFVQIGRLDPDDRLDGRWPVR